MYTLVDFITHVKGIEYILSISAIAGFLVFWEILKPKPFRTVVVTGKDDLAHIERTGGFGGVMKSVGKIVSAPFIGLAYIVMLPVAFFLALAAAIVNVSVKAVMGKSASFEWRPMEAYFSGKKKKEKDEKAKKGGSR